jgi:hypothetical protein
MLTVALATAALATFSFVTVGIPTASGTPAVPSGCTGAPPPSGDVRIPDGCHDGNVTTCAGAGLTADNQLSGDTSASDANVSGTVANDLLNVTLTNPNVQIVGVVVKGGPDYNLYPSVVSDMHAPNTPNGGTSPAGISHWFVCYNLGSPGSGPGPTPGGGGAGGGGAGAASPGAATPIAGRPAFTG